MPKTIDTTPESERGKKRYAEFTIEDHPFVKYIGLRPEGAQFFLTHDRSDLPEAKTLLRRAGIKLDRDSMLVEGDLQTALKVLDVPDREKIFEMVKAYIHKYKAHAETALES